MKKGKSDYCTYYINYMAMSGIKLKLVRYKRFKMKNTFLICVYCLYCMSHGSLDPFYIVTVTYYM